MYVLRLGRGEKYAEEIILTSSALQGSLPTEIGELSALCESQKMPDMRWSFRCYIITILSLHVLRHVRFYSGRNRLHDPFCLAFNCCTLSLPCFAGVANDWHNTIRNRQHQNIAAIGVAWVQSFWFHSKRARLIVGYPAKDHFEQQSTSRAASIRIGKPKPTK